jgi:hypothetical protein
VIVEIDIEQFREKIDPDPDLDLARFRGSA